MGRLAPQGGKKFPPKPQERDKEGFRRTLTPLGPQDRERGLVTGTLVSGVGQADDVALCPPFRARHSLSGSAPGWPASWAPLSPPGSWNLPAGPRASSGPSCTVTLVRPHKGALHPRRERRTEGQSQDRRAHGQVGVPQHPISKAWHLGINHAYGQP